jgi:hypothetical protein
MAIDDLDGPKTERIFQALITGKVVQESAMTNPTMRSYYVETRISRIAAMPRISVLSRPPPF